MDVYRAHTISVLLFLCMLLACSVFYCSKRGTSELKRMISDAIKTWGKFTRLLRSLYIIPYTWDSHTNSISIPSKRREFTYRIFVLQSLAVLLYEVFLIYRGVQELTSHNKLFVDKIPVLFSIAAYLLLNANQWIMLQNFYTYPDLFKNLFSLCSIFEVSVSTQGNDKKLRYGLILIAVGCASPALARAMGVFTTPEFPALLSSLHPTPQRMPKYLKILLACLHLTINAWHYLTFAFNLMSLLCYNAGVERMVKQLRIESGRRRNLVMLTNKYQQLSVLQSHFNSIAPISIFFWELTGLCSSAFNLFLGIVLGSFKGALVGFLSLTILVVEFKNFAIVYEESAPLLESWKSVTHSVWFRKYRLACRPLSVRVGSYYHVDKTLLLTIISVVITTTANLVLAFLYD